MCRTSINLLMSTSLWLLRIAGSLLSSTAKFSGGRALRDGFLLSDPTSGSRLRFWGDVFCGVRFFLEKGVRSHFSKVRVFAVLVTFRVGSVSFNPCLCSLIDGARWSYKKKINQNDTLIKVCLTTLLCNIKKCSNMVI